MQDQSLQAKIQGLQYENQMYKRLLDNLFLRSLFQGQPRTDDSIGAGNASFQYHPTKEHSSNVKNEEENNQFIQPGAEIFGACEIDADYDLDYEEEQEYLMVCVFLQKICFLFYSNLCIRNVYFQM